MKGNIMDKKILLGGAAALLLVGNMYATPANAAIDLSIGGEASLSATMNDACATAAANSDLELLLENVSGTAIASTEAGVNAYVAGLGVGHNAAVLTDDSTNDGTAATDFANTAITFEADPCSGADMDNPVWSFGKELSIGASGTLANGLGVSFSDTLDLTDTNAETGKFKLVLSGAFGDLQFKQGAQSAVDAISISESDYDVTGNDLGGHNLSTDGTGGMGILWTAPNMGALDLKIGYAPNSAGSSYDTAAYLDTFSIGVGMSVDALSIAAGYESASDNNNACTSLGANGLNAASGQTAQAAVNAVYGSETCGDQTLIYVGAAMSAGNIDFDVNYSDYDTEEADETVMSINAATTVGDYDLSLGYRQNTFEYEAVAEDTQSVVALGLGTSLGDGVDLGLSFSSSDVDLAAEALGNGSTNLYYAEAKLTVGF
jgi:hypothetical protein